MLTADYTGRFKKDYQSAIRRRLDILLIDQIIRNLINEVSLPAKNKDHALSGDFAGYRECHIQSDWLLIYQVGNEVIVFECTGTHSDLF
jgi:mRNA interferase YafQ